jgi:hypothetical protein
MRLSIERFSSELKFLPLDVKFGSKLILDFISADIRNISACFGCSSENYSFLEGTSLM